MTLKNLQDAAVEGKKILVRLDTDVSLSQTGKILDTTRLTAGRPTIDYLLSHSTTIILCGHVGRPKGSVVSSMSLLPVAKWYAENYELQITNYKLDEFDGWKLADDFLILENLRFYPGEEANDASFSQQLASLADIYVDDAFAVSHRKAASNVGVTAYLSSYAGMQLQKEVTELSKILENPARPLVIVIGGAKLETKLPLVSKMHQFADALLVGGKLVQEKGTLETITKEPGRAVLHIASPNENGLDISSQSVDEFISVIRDAKTVVWNGPVGKTSDEKDSVALGTKRIAESIVSTKAYTVVGGGDTLEYLDRIHLLGKFSFVSTGGGAMLSFLSGESLPALVPLII